MRVAKGNILGQTFSIAEFVSLCHLSELQNGMLLRGRGMINGYIGDLYIVRLAISEETRRFAEYRCVRFDRVRLDTLIDDEHERALHRL